MEMIFLKIEGGRVLIDSMDIIAIEETLSGCLIKTVDEVYQVNGTFEELMAAKMRASEMDKALIINFSQS